MIWLATAWGADVLPVLPAGAKLRVVEETRDGPRGSDDGTRTVFHTDIDVLEGGTYGAAKLKYRSTIVRATWEQRVGDVVKTYDSDEGPPDDAQDAIVGAAVGVTWTTSIGRDGRAVVETNVTEHQAELAETLPLKPMVYQALLGSYQRESLVAAERSFWGSLPQTSVDVGGTWVAKHDQTVRSWKLDKADDSGVRASAQLVVPTDPRVPDLRCRQHVHLDNEGMPASTEMICRGTSEGGPVEVVRKATWVRR